MIWQKNCKHKKGTYKIYVPFFLREIAFFVNKDSTMRFVVNSIIQQYEHKRQ